ncbi:signal peptide peptidase SppA [beta proteobacterium AAP99]|nr:signal peptide peptidase SppA [beta proteobacterium AAP99]
MPPAPPTPPTPPTPPGDPKKPGWFARIWGWVDASRRLMMNLIFLAIVILLLISMFSGGGIKVQDKTALVLALDGPIVEQYHGGVRDRISRQAQGQDTDQIQLRDLIAVLDKAAKDDKISSVVLITDEFRGAGMATLREAAAAMERFKAGGKKIVAWGSGYDQRQYYLAAHASEVYMHPMGMVMIEGFGRYRTYYKDAFDRLGVSANVVKVGTFKNAAEPYFANGPSKESLEAEAYLWDALWKAYTDGVEKARKLPAGSIAKNIEALPEQLKAAGGDPAKLAIDGKLIDGFKTRDELRALMTERGAEDKQNKTFRQVSFGDYLSTIKPAKGGEAVGVIVAEGEIGDGFAPPGRIGGRSTAELVRKAREDDSIKAIVLRVDSPGGSGFGSELIRRELELTRAAGKPVVVSMGDLAASGGYWISMASDEVIAEPTTITGSIGVFGMLPTAGGLMEKLSIKTGGYTTTWLGGAYDPRRGLDPRFEGMVQSAINHFYNDFVGKAAAFRKMSVEDLNKVAQGRVWTGQQALDRKLVDRVGSFDDALKSARERAKLKADALVRYVEAPPSPFEQFLKNFGLGAAADAAVDSSAAAVGAAISSAMVQNAPLATVGLNSAAAPMVEDFMWVNDLMQRSRAGQPFVVLMHCFCDK